MGASRLKETRKEALVSSGHHILSLPGSVDVLPVQIMEKGMSSTAAKRVEATAQAVTGIEYSESFSRAGNLIILASHDALLHATLFISLAIRNRT